MRAMDGGAAYDDLGELYDVWCAEVTEDIPFYLGLASALARDLGRVDGVLDIVELGAGSGRISAPLAAAGHRVTAIDASSAQLQRLAARARADAPSATVVAHHADMRGLGELVAPASVDLVIAPFRAFLHVTPDRDAVLASAREVLRAGGVLAFDVFHPSAEQVSGTHERWTHRRAARTMTGRWRFDERAVYDTEKAAEPGGLALGVDVRCSWAPSRRPRRETVGTLPDPADTTGNTVVTVAELHLQLVPPERWRASIERAGLTLDGCYGWFDGRPFDRDADDDSIWVARRPAD